MLAAAGIAVGLVLAFALTRFLAGFLFAVTPTDPITLVVVVASLGVAALLASFIPARRATRTDPVEVLRRGLSGGVIPSAARNPCSLYREAKDSSLRSE